MTSEQPLYERDPAAWHQHLVEGNAKQPRKRVGVDVLIRDNQGRILIVNPAYKPDWDLPGGMAEANESPIDAATRELKEELGISPPIGAMLCVDWVAPHGAWDDSVMFIFDGGIMDPVETAALHPVDPELMEFRFADNCEAQQLLRPYFWRRVKSAIEALQSETPIYLQNGAAH